MSSDCVCVSVCAGDSVSTYAEKEYNAAIELIDEFFVKTRDDMFISNYATYVLEKRIQDHLEQMVRILSGVECKKLAKRIPSTLAGFSAENELIFVLKSVKNLFILASDEEMEETWYFGFIMAEISAHLQRIKAIHYKEHEESYSRDFIEKWAQEIRYSKVN